MADLSRALGHAANERGMAREETLLSVMHEGPLPRFARTVRMATPEEDRRGIDVVVESDIGPLYLQVKGTRRAKQEFEQKRRPSLVAVVLVDAHAPRSTLLGRAVGALCSIRQQVMARMGGSDV